MFECGNGVMQSHHIRRPGNRGHLRDFRPMALRPRLSPDLLLSCDKVEKDLKEKKSLGLNPGSLE